MAVDFRVREEQNRQGIAPADSCLAVCQRGLKKSRVLLIKMIADIGETTEMEV